MTWERTYVPPRAVALPVYLFDQQRALREACRHLDVVIGRGGETWHCRSSKSRHNTCSFMRTVGEPCGPEGKSFEAKEGGAS